MEWQDEATILSVRHHGETSLLVGLFSRDHGRHAGLARGAAGPRRRGDFQPGNQVAAKWRGRLAEHLGSFACELTAPRAARCMADPDALAALSSACALCDASLPERLPMPRLYERLQGLLDAVAAVAPSWQRAYVAWEVALLAELGFGLDLTRCAVTGSADDLAYVSPRTGRAVARHAAGAYAERLLPLPRFLHAPEAPAEDSEIADGLRLAGHFLHAHVFAERKPPDARARLVVRLSRPGPARQAS